VAVTLRLNLDDQATQGLENFNEALGATAPVAKATAAEMQQLTAAHQQQVKVIHEHRGSLLEFAGDTVSGLAKATAAWLSYRQSVMWLQTLQAPLQVASSGMRTLASSTSFVATSGLRALSFVPRFGAAVSTTIPIISGATLALTAHEMVLARTGIRFTQSAAATEEQRMQFSRLKAEADSLHQSLARVAKSQGVDLAGLGVSSGSNLDRLKGAAGDLGSSITRPLVDLARGARDASRALNPLVPIWREIDAAATRSTDQMIENIGHVKNLSESLADSFFGEGYSERVRQMDQLTAKRKDELDDFARLRDVHRTLEQERSAAANLQRVRSLQSTSDIDGEIQRIKDKAGALASSSQFSEQEAQRLHSTLSQLEQQRTEIIDRETERRKDLETKYRDYQKQLAHEWRDEQQAILRGIIDRHNAEYDRQQALLKQRTEGARDLQRTAANEALQSAIAALEAEGATADDVHQAKLRLIQQETDQRITAADDDESRQKAWFDGQQRRLQAEGDFHRRQMMQQAQDRKAKTEEEERLEKEKQQRLQQLLQQAGGPDGRQMVQSLDPRAVRSAYQQRQADQAERAFRQNNSYDMTDARAFRRFNAQANQVRRSAETQAYRDFNRGNVDPAQMANAQAQAGQQALQALQQNGQLSQQVLQVLQQQLQTAATEQATLAQLQQQVQQLATVAGQQGQQANQTRTRAQQGGLRR